MSDADIDQFIQQQKAKLANERQNLNNETDTQSRNLSYQGRPERQKWAQFNTGNAPSPAEQKREFTPEDRGLPLTNRAHDDKQRLLAEERNREYNAMMAKRPQKPQSESRPQAAPRRQGLDIGHYEDDRKALDLERREEFRKYLEQQKSKNANPPPKQVPGNSEGRERQETVNTGDGRYDYQENKKRLAEERRKEYNDLLQAKTEAKNRAREPEIDNPSIIPFNRVEQDKMKTRIMEEERRREYNQVKAKLENKPRQQEFTPPETYGLPVGAYEKTKQKEKEQQEYKAMLDLQQEHQRQMHLLQQGVPYERISRIAEKENYGNDFDSYTPDFAQRKSDLAMTDPGGYDFKSDYTTENQRAYNTQSRVQFDPEVNYKQYTPSPQLKYHQPTNERDSPSKLHNSSSDSRQQQNKRFADDEYRKQWKQDHAVPILKLELPRAPENKLSEYERELEKVAYKEEWRKAVARGEVLEPGSGRKKWDKPLKLSPRGLLDTDDIVDRVERDRYKAEWRAEHGIKEGGSRSQGQTMTRGGGSKLDTDSIVAKVTGEKNNPDFMPQKPGQKANALNLYSSDEKPGFRRPLEENYTHRGEAHNTKDNEKNINHIIAEAQKDASEHRKKWGTGNDKKPVVSDNNSGSYRTSADYRKRLIEIRNKEYNELLKKKKEEGRSVSREWNSPVTAAEETPFPLGLYEQKQKDFIEERKKECHDYMYRSQQSPQYFVQQENRRSRLPNDDDSSQDLAFPLGSYAKVRQKLNEERRRDYNSYLKQDNITLSPRSQKRRDVALLIKEDGRQERLRKMQDERNKDYNEMLAQKLNSHGQDTFLQNDPQQEGLFHGLGAFDEERKRQKRQFTENTLNVDGGNRVDITIRRGYQGTNLQQQTDDFKANSLPVNASDNAKWQKVKERNDEYNQFLASKNERDRNRFADKKGAPQEENGQHTRSILGISTNSAQRRRMTEERNKEYNDMIKQKKERPTPRQGWGTPDYQDLLEKSRAREQNFRRANDMAYETAPQTRHTEWRYKELDRDLEAKKKAYQRDRYFNTRTPVGGILEDPNWLSPRNANAERNYNHMEDAKEKPANTQSKKNYHDVVTDDRTVPKGRRNDKGGEYYYASLPLGREAGSAQRRQREYRDDLQKQMAETAHARQIERQEGIKVNNTSLAAPATTRIPKQRLAAPRTYDSILTGAGIEDDLSPRSLAILGRRQHTGDRRRHAGLNGGYGGGRDADLGNPILDLGILQNNNARATSLDPPAALVYQPSTFITANAVPTLNNSVDEAYNFYATKNPLDPDLKGEVGYAYAPASEVVRGGPASVPALNLAGVTGDGAAGRGVKFNEARGRPTVAAQGMVFDTDEDKKKGQRQNADDYRLELERQIAEKNVKKMRAKEEQERYELKMEEEARNYDPFGKGGGGAPMRDTQGNVISDLRQIRSDNVNLTRRSGKNDLSPRVGFAFDPVAAGNTSRAANSYRDDLIGPPPTQTTADGEASFARGGHGIFGMPKTDNEKLQADRYKVDLRRQIEEKRADEQRKKQEEKLEEQREQRLLDDQRTRMQLEYDEEQRRIMEKKEEARLKNEEMMRQAEEKKRELERERREDDEMRQQELREAHEREILERQRAEENQRGKSPPIPALQGKDDKEEQKEPKEQKALDSPPIPAARTRTVEPDVIHQDTGNRAQSADVLNQLTRLRAELRKESDRVQTMLHDQEDDVEIYDPRHIQRPPPGPVVTGARPDIDVFETAMNRNAVAVRRTPADRANSTVMSDFNSLKNKHDSDSRKHFRNLYPNEPGTNDALEAQQAALLKQQENRLRNLKDRRALEDTSALRIGRDIHSSSSQLHSNSAFVDVNGISGFPDDFEDMPKRNDSARYRRRNRVPSSPRIERFATPEINSRSTFGSQTSLNVDKLARKNEDRLRKLRDMQGDDLSLYDPEDVLNRFMSKQDHNRPPSRNTLLDDTWMRAGSKQSKY